MISKMMHRILIGLLFAYIGYFLPVAFAEQPTGVSFQKGASIDKKAPEFSLEDIKGDKVNLKELCGKPILLKFWTSWCPFCRKEIPKVNKLYEDYSQKGLVILAIDIEETKAKISSFAQKQNIKYKILFDLDGEVAKSYEVMGVPTYVLIDKDCLIRYTGNSRPERTLIEKLL
ncbi:MAG: TlpA family protein disulfide reductase [Candidatus Omnitrophota bacterium]